MKREAGRSRSPAADSREKRLAKALRENLKRRKAPQAGDIEATAPAAPGKAPE